MGEQKHLLQLTANVTERDNSHDIWLPLLRKLFAVNGQIVRINNGESALVQSTIEKQENYPIHKGVVGFKVDLRCLYDFGNVEYNIASFEACLPDADQAKIVYDQAKLIREAKINLVQLQYLLHDQAYHSWSVQLIGLKAVFRTAVYNGDDLFVCVPQFTVEFPCCLKDLDEFTAEVSKLSSFSFYVEETARSLKSTLLKNPTDDECIQQCL